MLRRIGYALIPVMLLILIWYTVLKMGLVSPLFLPYPREVVVMTFAMVKDGSLWIHTSASLARASIGFIIALLIGVPLGLGMGYSKRVYDSMQFLVDFCRSIPATALFPLFMLMFGIGNEARIALVVRGASLLLIVNTMYGVHFAKMLRIRAAKLFGISGWRLFAHVILPEALPHIFSGMRMAISLALVITVVTEMFIGTKAGLGFAIMDAQLVYKTDVMYATIIVTGILGYLLNVVFLKREGYLIHWKGK